MKYQKIHSLLALHGIKLLEYGDYIGLSRTTIHNKKRADSCKADDLIKLGELTNTRLAMIDENDRPVIIFTSDDISAKNKKSDT